VALLTDYEEARASLMFGQMVHDRRVELGLTQGRAGRARGYDQPQLSHLESGGATPTVPLLARLAAALNADLETPLGALLMARKSIARSCLAVLIATPGVAIWQA
jgi:transcriptional regulator with XRE-family HTH domain